jgi:hypothetical protein
MSGSSEAKPDDVLKEEVVTRHLAGREALPRLRDGLPSRLSTLRYEERSARRLNGAG